MRPKLTMTLQKSIKLNEMDILPMKFILVDELPPEEFKLILISLYRYVIYL